MQSAARATQVVDARRRARPRASGCRPIRLVAATGTILVACLGWTATAFAAPANDAFEASTSIADLPYSDSVDLTDATTESGEPQFCFSGDRTVWYAVTATRDTKLAARSSSSTAYSQVTAYSSDGSGIGGLSFLGCSNFWPANAVFDVQAGETYYLQVSTFWGTTGTVQLDLEEQLPPPNDDFADATAFSSVPFSGSADMTAATVEDGEPSGCQGLSSQQTAWYAFTPSQSGSYIAERSGYGSVSAYTGSSVSSVHQVSCGYYQTIFHADAGTTYYLQLSGTSFGGVERLSLDRAPAARASFFYWPSDPSVFDTVSFSDYSYDIAGIASRKWRLSDGFTSTASGFGHRFAADGSYDATLDITTTDGRTATNTQTVPVKTHDVAITGMTVPSKGRAGRTKPISVAVNNSRYAETVQVSILRGVAGRGFEQVGQVTQGVPARSARNKTSFEISYTFSDEDAEFGKVTFEAVATILTARDANPADNTVIAPATTVTG